MLTLLSIYHSLFWSLFVTFTFFNGKLSLEYIILIPILWHICSDTVPWFLQSLTTSKGYWGYILTRILTGQILYDASLDNPLSYFNLDNHTSWMCWWIPGKYSHCFAKWGTPPSAIHSCPTSVLNFSHPFVPTVLMISMQITCPDPPLAGLPSVPDPR